MTTACARYNGPARDNRSDRALPRRVAQPKLVKNTDAVPRDAAVLPAARLSAAAAAAPVPGRAQRTPPRLTSDPAAPALRMPLSKTRLAYAGALPPARIPPESLAASGHARTIGVAIATSVAIHALALTLHFTIGSGRSADRDPPLEVALVNARSTSRPTKADLLAQANLDGGGNTEQDRRARTPLPVLPAETPRQNIAAKSSRQEVQDNTAQEMLTQLRSSTAIATPEPKPLEDPEHTESPTANELMQKTFEAMRLEAKIARDMDAYQKIPRRKHIGAQAREYRFARYVEDWRMKVERIGNLNYPEAARRNRLYGSLILTVSIRADGSIENVEVNRKSGRRILDAAAVKIVEMAGPYAPFPDDIRRDTDILSITRMWTFARGDELRSE